MIMCTDFGYVIEGPDDDEDSSVNTPPMNFNQNFGSQIHTESSSYWPSSSEASYALDSIVHEDDAQMTEVGMVSCCVIMRTFLIFLMLLSSILGFRKGGYCPCCSW